MQTFSKDTVCRNCNNVLPCFTKFQFVIDIVTKLAQHVLLCTAYKLIDVFATHYIPGEFFILQQDSLLFHAEPATPTSIWWHTLSVASSIAFLQSMSVQNVDELKKVLLVVWYGMNILLTVQYTQ